MTVYGIFGNKTDASGKLITAALNDLLEAHISDTPDEPLWLCVGVNKDSQAPIYQTIAKWAVRNEIFVAWYTTLARSALREHLDIPDSDEYQSYKSEAGYLSELVERLYKESRNGERAVVYALLGDKEPSVDVRRALVRAMDNGLEVRDLAEAGLTYVGVADNPIRQGSTVMANEELTLQQAGEAADEGDEEALTELSNLAERFELDPDEYPTWAELATALDPLLAAAEGDQEEEEEPASAPARSRGTETLTADELDALAVPELRQLAKQLGVDGWDKNRSAKLIEGILAAQGNGGDEAADAELTREYRAAKASDNGDDFRSAFARGLRAFADALEG